jgi:hypothetical protein
MSSFYMSEPASRELIKKLYEVPVMNKPTVAQLKDSQWWGVWASEDATHYSEYYGAFVKPFDSVQWVVLRQGPKPVVTFMDTGMLFARPESCPARPAVECGMKIDIERLKVDADYWSEHAPAEATHYCTGDSFSPWLRETSNDVCWLDAGAWFAYTSHDVQTAHLKSSIPKPAAPINDEIFLPPAGCECEYQFGGDGFAWHRCQVQYILLGDKDPDADGWRAIIWCPHLEMDQLASSPKFQFRPILSPAEREREIAIDAALSYINRDYSSQPSATIGEYVAKAVAQLYDAGRLRRADK